MMHDAFHLKVALSLMRLAQPIRWRECLVACRRSRLERKRVLRNFRAHYLFLLLCRMHGVKP